MAGRLIEPRRCSSLSGTHSSRQASMAASIPMLSTTFEGTAAGRSARSCTCWEPRRSSPRTSCIACHTPGTWHTAYGTQGPTKQGPMCPYPAIHQIAKNPPWQAPPDRLQTLPQDSWAMRPRRSAAGASRHGGPLTRRKLSPLQKSMSASQQPLRSPVSRRVLPSIHLHVCSAATCSWHCTA